MLNCCATMFFLLVFFLTMASAQDNFQCPDDELICKNERSDVNYLPELIILPGNKTITSGDDVRFFCRDKSKLRVPVYWIFGSDLASAPSSMHYFDGYLTMLNIQPENSGTYVCKAMGNYSVDSSTSVYLKVQPKTITNKPTISNLTSGNPISCGHDQFKCRHTEQDNHHQCFPLSYRCDGIFDCWDNSDEIECHPCSSASRNGIIGKCRYNLGFTTLLVHRNSVPVTHLRINATLNQISYDFPNPRYRSPKLYWSLPQQFTGDKLKAYGGNLYVTQRFYERPGISTGQIFTDFDVILTSRDRISIGWTNPNPIPPGKTVPYAVPLKENEKWCRLLNNRPWKNVTKQEMMWVLSHLQSVEIRATFSYNMAYTSISNVVMETATPVVKNKGFLRMELEPVNVPLIPGQKIIFFCTYCGSIQPLDIEFQVIGKNNSIISGDSFAQGMTNHTPVPRDSLDGYLWESRQTLSLLVDSDYQEVKCHVTNSQKEVVGELKSLIHEETSADHAVDSTSIETKPIIVQINSSVVMECQTSLPKTTVQQPITWLRSQGMLPESAQIQGFTLTITDVREEDAGIYVCTTSNVNGTSSAKHVLTLEVV